MKHYFVGGPLKRNEQSFVSVVRPALLVEARSGLLKMFGVIARQRIGTEPPPTDYGDRSRS